MSVLSPSADFVFGNTRLRARKAALLASGTYETLMGRDLEGLLEALADTAYHPEVEAARVGPVGERVLHEALRQHFARLLREMRSFYEGRARELVDLLLARFDLHNLLVLLRGLARGHTAEQMVGCVVPLGSLGDGAAREIARQPQFVAAIDRLVSWRLPDPETARALASTWPGFERTQDLAALEDAVAAAHARNLQRALLRAGSSANPLRELLAREADAANALIALRLRSALEREELTSLPPPPDAGRWLAGGAISEHVLEVVLRLPARADAATALAAGARGWSWSSPFERFAANGDLAALQRALEADRVRWAFALFLRGEQLGIDIPIAYTVSLENETRNLRRVAEAAVIGLPAESVRPQLLLPGDGEAWAA
jgi:V/A-type H+/Na+-transporting ATPase subunit C